MNSMVSRLLVLPFAVLLLACNNDSKGTADQGESAGDGDGDPTGDGDGDGAPGDGDGSPTGDGDGDCTPGELGCSCSNGLCLGDFECVNGVCVNPCIPGELGCQCNNGLCLGDLECSGGICLDPNCIPGELWCECNNGLCLGDYVCNGNVCMEPSGDGDGDPTGDGDGEPGDGDGDPTGDGDGEPNPCPLPNQKVCNGDCIDVMQNDNNCGTCGKVCPTNIEDGGCADGMCKPFWSACFVPTVDFNNCNEACAAEGKTCAYMGCAGFRTYKTYSNPDLCAINSTQGDTKYSYMCDQQLQLIQGITVGQCCCNIP